MDRDPQLSPLPLAGEGGAAAPGEGRFARRPHSRQLQRARALRSAATEAEARLWYHLRAQRFFGLKFRRQKPVGPYIVDFVCEDHHLVVELDGGQHARDCRHYDAVRDRTLAAAGYAVLRFWNDEALGQTDAVLERIRQHCGAGVESAAAARIHE